MTLIFLVGLAAVWLAIVGCVSRISAKLVPSAEWRVPIAVFVFATLLPLPLIDEIVGGRQFEKLCRENSTIKVDPSKAMGKTVYLAEDRDIQTKGTWVRIVLKRWRFIDVTTNEPILTFNIVMASGGRLIQTLGIAEGGGPLTFKGSCQPSGARNLDALFKTLQITNVNRPTLGPKEEK
jgi:hypothetical protein